MRTPATSASRSVRPELQSQLLRRQRQEDCEFKASLGTFVRLCLKIKNKEGWGAAHLSPGLSPSTPQGKISEAC